MKTIYFVNPKTLLVESMCVPESIGINIPLFLGGDDESIIWRSGDEGKIYIEREAQRLRKERTGWQVGDIAHWMANVRVCSGGPHHLQAAVVSVDPVAMTLGMDTVIYRVKITDAFHTREEADESLPAWEVNMGTMEVRQCKFTKVKTIREQGESLILCGGGQWGFSSKILAERWRDEQPAWEVNWNSLKVYTSQVSLGYLLNHYSNRMKGGGYFDSGMGVNYFVSQPLAQAWADAERAKRDVKFYRHSCIRCTAAYSSTDKEKSYCPDCEEINRLLRETKLDYCDCGGDAYFHAIGRPELRYVECRKCGNKSKEIMTYGPEDTKKAIQDLANRWNGSGGSDELRKGKSEQAILPDGWCNKYLGPIVQVKDRNNCKLYCLTCGLCVKPKEPTKPWPQPGNKVWVWNNSPVQAIVVHVSIKDPNLLDYVDVEYTTAQRERFFIGNIHLTRAACLKAEYEREIKRDSKEGQ